ncbi:MAG: hypothetical protein NVSMB32_03950 [Actinomycetota bacterium]
MASREERAALNEVASRDLNEGIEASHEKAGRQGYVRMLCECANGQCDRVIAISLGEYEAVRRNPRRFVVARLHVLPEIETVVEDRERFLVVEKDTPVGAALAEEHDPRQPPDQLD